MREMFHRLLAEVVIHNMSKKFDQVKMKVLEQCRISPPPKSVCNTSIPLTLLDIEFLYVSPAQSVFLYKSASFSDVKFTKEIISRLKKSLSLTLQQFFPLCGNCVCPPEPSEPYLLYKDGDSVPLLVAQCADNVTDFLQYEPTDAKKFRLLVPQTLPKRKQALNDNGTLKEVELTSLLAVQITLFKSNSGICIGVTHHHVAADGMSLIHFVKTWASICKAKCDMSRVSMSFPVYDKGFVKDTLRIKKIRLNQWRALGSPVCNDTIALKEDCVRAIFTVSRFDIDRLKKWISAKCYTGMYLSSFVAIGAYLWVCLIKTLDLITADKLSKEMERCHFAVVADCRNNYGMPTFFGNCLIGKLVSFARSIFKQQDCVATVAEALSNCVQSFKAGQVSATDLLTEFPKWEEALSKGENIVTITSTPKQAAYETDFGWGHPERVEGVHIDSSGSISLSQSRYEEGGIEIGLCRSRHEMQVFTSIFESGLNQFRYRVML